jgi:hypothetical protein
MSSLCCRLHDAARTRIIVESLREGIRIKDGFFRKVQYAVETLFWFHWLVLILAGGYLLIKSVDTFSSGTLLVEALGNQSFVFGLGFLLLGFVVQVRKLRWLMMFAYIGLGFWMVGPGSGWFRALPAFEHELATYGILYGLALAYFQSWLHEELKDVKRQNAVVNQGLKEALRSKRPKQ